MSDDTHVDRTGRSTASTAALKVTGQAHATPPSSRRPRLLHARDRAEHRRRGHASRASTRATRERAPACCRADATATRRACRSADEPRSSRPAGTRAARCCRTTASTTTASRSRVVVADTLEHARDAARLVRVDVRGRARAARLRRGEAAARTTRRSDGATPDRHVARRRRRAALARGRGPRRAVYTTPIENHNPMEPHATIARVGRRAADALRRDAVRVRRARRRSPRRSASSPENVRVISPFVGGGFGCKGSTWSHVVLAAMAAREVRTAGASSCSTRPQMFGPVGGRPHDRAARRARREARRPADRPMRHDVVSHTSRSRTSSSPRPSPTRMLYACAERRDDATGS